MNYRAELGCSVGKIMISSVPSYDEELFNSAYANIGLIADKGWAFYREDPFRKLNHTLWVQNCKLSEKYLENGNNQPRFVRNRIPNSRLANYGNYEYNAERERMYKPGDNHAPFVRHLDSYNGDAITEPWMLKEVEEQFARLSSRASRIPLNKNEQLFTQLRLPAVFHLNNLLGPEDYDKYLPPRYTIENMAEMQLQMRIASDAIRDLWNPDLKALQQTSALIKPQQNLQSSRRQQYIIHCNQQQQQYLQFGLQNQTLPIRPGRNFNSSTESVGMIRRPHPPILSAEVPEFFPKGPIFCRSKDHREPQLPLKFFPSSAERSYQDELFPYNRSRSVPSGSGNIFQNASVPILQQQVTNAPLLGRQSPQWVHQRPNHGLQIQIPVCPSLNQPVCRTSMKPVVCPTIIQRQIQMADDKLAGNNMIPQQGSGLVSAPIPVYQRPPELYNNNDPSTQRGRNNNKSQGVDFKNLILLTKSAMKARRNPQQSSSFILESRQPNLKSESDVLQWLEKGYPKRAREFVAVDTLVSDFRNFQTLDKSLGDKSIDNYLVVDTSSSDLPTKKRLYRDVLTNSSSSEIIVDNLFEKRYDELEREAMEQYRTSEECLALRYQELERQAMEQYRNGDNGNGGTSNIQSRSLSPANNRTKIKQQDQNVAVVEEECVDGHRCSGFGHCSPVEESKKGLKSITETLIRLQGTHQPPREPITIVLRPESRSMTNTSHREDFHIKYSSSTVVTKSLTTLKKRFSPVSSKNKIRGASGDENERIVNKASPKRRLMLMSPSKRESEARSLPKKSSGVEETYAFRSMNNNKQHVSSESYHEQPELVQTGGGGGGGGGDERVTGLLRSSGTEGIRKQLFLSNEELITDSSPESLGIIRFLVSSTAGNGPRLRRRSSFIKISEERIFDTHPETLSSFSDDSPLASIFRQRREHRQQISNRRLTKNKIKQLKPYKIIAIKDSKLLHRPNTIAITLIKLGTFLSRLREYELQLVGTLPPHNNLLTSKIRSKFKKFRLTLEPKSELQKIISSPLDLDKQIYYLIITADSLHYSLGILRSMRSGKIHCNTAKKKSHL